MFSSTRWLVVGVACAACAGISWSQAPVAADDAYGVPYGTPLVVEAPGVLANDSGAGVAELVTSASHGVLDCESDPGAYDLCPDGSFTYTPDTSFSGSDSFTYRVVAGGGTSLATVNLAACTGGPTVIVCWQEAAFFTRLGELGYSVFQEGFEDDAAWGMTREPFTEPSVVSRGIRWESNHPDPPASNELTTGDGAARTGLWGVYDPEHGYATGTTIECDVDTPPDTCRYQDGFTGTREPGQSTLYAVGGHLRGSLQPNLAMILDGGAAIGLGRLNTGAHQFFGVIDRGGFRSFRLEERDGKIGQNRLVFGDDFSLGVLPADTTPPRVALVDSFAGSGGGELAEGELTWASISQLLVTFNEPVRDLGETAAGSVSNPASFMLVTSGGDGFETTSCSGGVAGTDQAVPVDWVTWEGGSVLTATLDVNGGSPLEGGAYRLYVCSGAVADWTGNPLDGDGDGVGGDDFVRSFGVIGNNPAVAASDAYTLSRGASMSIPAPGVLANDSDSDGDPLTAQLASPPAHAAAFALQADGSFDYTHDGLSVEADSFAYRAFDGVALSGVATVTLNVLPAPFTWYVAPGGSDLLDCRSSLTACATLGEVAARALDGDTILAAAGIYPESLTLTRSLTVSGAAPGAVLDAGGAAVALTVAAGATVTLSGFEIRGATVGGVEVFGDLTVASCWVHGNGDGGAGSFGGLQNLGVLRLRSSTVSGNSGDVSGGVGNVGQLELTNSTVFGNLGAMASGVENAAGATLDLSYSTIAGNAAYGIRNGGTATMAGTIVAGHGTAACIGALTTLGHNLEDGDSCGLDPTAGDLVGLDPMLAPLAANGGPTPTLALASGSPAVDAGGADGCPSTDQRGVARPVDGDGDELPVCDVGSYELVAGSIFADGFESGGLAAWSAVVPGP